MGVAYIVLAYIPVESIVIAHICTNLPHRDFEARLFFVFLYTVMADIGMASIVMVHIVMIEAGHGSNSYGQHKLRYGLCGYSPYRYSHVWSWTGRLAYPIYTYGLCRHARLCCGPERSLYTYQPYIVMACVAMAYIVMVLPRRGREPACYVPERSLYTYRP